ncbi:MAG TPA: M1 family aminopeptidase [Kofleriaceae bacterium]
MRLLLLALVLVACGDDASTMPDADEGPIEPVANLDREVVDTRLTVDVTALSGTASITIGASQAPGASLEIGDLTIDSVTLSGVPVPFAVTGKQLDLGLRAGPQVGPIDIAYHFKLHEQFDGMSMKGYTLLWPYHCGNLFPCHSQPADGTTFTLDLQGVPAGKTAVFPAEISEAPSYQVAWAIGDYTELALGTTTAGTQISVWHLPNEATNAMNGTQNLVAAFDWFEKTIGPYRFGTKAGTVSVAWGGGALGGMEHHPRWHVGSGALGSQEVNVHEAAHGWFGDGIRIQCWEDFVLSEGTTTYLAARALDVVAPTIGAQTWTGYANELGGIPPTAPVWPQSCGTIDILDDNLFSNAPYIRGAFFYKGVADKVGAAKLDEALAAFYGTYGGRSATMMDMLATIQTVTGYDATACAQSWLRSTIRPMPGPCP